LISCAYAYASDAGDDLVSARQDRVGRDGPGKLRIDLFNMPVDLVQAMFVLPLEKPNGCSLIVAMMPTGSAMPSEPSTLCL
jgi:hypothetical protein